MLFQVFFPLKHDRNDYPFMGIFPHLQVHLGVVGRKELK